MYSKIALRRRMYSRAFPSAPPRPVGFNNSRRSCQEGSFAAMSPILPGFTQRPWRRSSSVGWKPVAMRGGRAARLTEPRGGLRRAVFVQAYQEL